MWPWRPSIAEGGVVGVGPFQAYFGEIRRAVPAPRRHSGCQRLRPATPLPPAPDSVSHGLAAPRAARRTVLPEPALQQPDAAADQAAMPESGDGPAKPEFWRKPASPLESLWYRGWSSCRTLATLAPCSFPATFSRPGAAGGCRPGPQCCWSRLPVRFQPGPSPDLLAICCSFSCSSRGSRIKPVHGSRLPKRALVALNSRLSVSQVNIAAAQDETETPYIRLLHRLLVELAFDNRRWCNPRANSGRHSLAAARAIGADAGAVGTAAREVRLDETCAIRLSSFDDDERTATARGQIARLIAACPVGTVGLTGGALPEGPARLPPAPPRLAPRRRPRTAGAQRPPGHGCRQLGPRGGRLYHGGRFKDTQLVWPGADG